MNRFLLSEFLSLQKLLEPSRMFLKIPRESLFISILGLNPANLQDREVRNERKARDNYETKTPSSSL
jgi:hypothetical protein